MLGLFLGTRRFGCTKIGATWECLGGAQHATTPNSRSVTPYSCILYALLCNRITRCSVTEGHERIPFVIRIRPQAQPMGDKPLRNLCRRRELGQRSVLELGRAIPAECGVGPLVSPTKVAASPPRVHYMHGHRKMNVGGHYIPCSNNVKGMSCVYIVPTVSSATS